MTPPLTPTNPPRLAGTDSPRVTRPDGARVQFLADDVRLVEHRDGTWTAETDDLDPVQLDRAEVVRAAAGVANLVTARLHDARLAARVLDVAIHGDDVSTWTRIGEGL